MEELPILTQACPLRHDAAGGSYVTVVGITSWGETAFVRSADPMRSWELPGGALKPGEPALAGAAREFWEETGWHIEGLIGVAVIHNVLPGNDRIHSRVFVAAGFVRVGDDVHAEDPDIQERAFMKTAPKDCTFGNAWVDELIRISVQRLSAAENQRMWDGAAAAYESKTTISEEDLHYGPLIGGESSFRLLPALCGTRVLDLGCGAGHNLAAMRRGGAASGLGIDFSAKQVERARQRVGGGSFKIEQADIMAYTFVADAPFDIIISVFSLAFVRDIGAVLNVAGQCLRPGGTLVLSTDHPCRVGVWNDDHLRIADWYAPRIRRRFWTVPGYGPLPYVHHLHDLSALVNAIASANLVLDGVLEPRALAFHELDKAPYRSTYHEGRYRELSRIPYTLILKAHRPGRS